MLTRQTYKKINTLNLAVSTKVNHLHCNVCIVYKMFLIVYLPSCILCLKGFRCIVCQMFSMRMGILIWFEPKVKVYRDELQNVFQ